MEPETTTSSSSQGTPKRARRTKDTIGAGVRFVRLRVGADEECDGDEGGVEHSLWRERKVS
jgi:hypothetical protein